LPRRRHEQNGKAGRPADPGREGAEIDVKIALLTVNAGAGGVVNVVWQLARGLASRGHSMTVVSDGGGEIPRLREWGVDHVLIPFNRGWRDLLPARRALKRFLRESAPDIVHSHSRWPSMVSSAGGRRPDVSTLHLDRLTSHGSMFDRGLLRRLLSVWGHWVTTLDEATRVKLIRDFGLAPVRVRVVPNGVNSAEYAVPSEEERAQARRALGVEKPGAVAAYVGSMVDWKGPDRAVRALAQARRDGAVDATLLLCGDGPYFQNVKSLAAELNVEADCRFLGWRNPKQVYHAADFLVLPSRSEGFGLVCVEAMLSGLPVLRTRAGGCDLQIIEGRTGWAVDVDDDAELARKFLAAARDREGTRSCGARAREHALGNFTEERFLDAMATLYTEAAASRS